MTEPSLPDTMLDDTVFVAAAIGRGVLPSLQHHWPDADAALESPIGGPTTITLAVAGRMYLITVERVTPS